MRRSAKEAVNHPIHYGGDIVHEVYKCLAGWGLVTSSAYLWNAAKYIGRAGKKDDVLEDLKKARWYLDREIERLTPPAPKKRKRISRSRTRSF
jgi:hypothetical protein